MHDLHANLGLATDLLLHAQEGTDRLVMVADEDYHAGRIYETLGFSAQGRLASLCRMPELDSGPRRESTQPPPAGESKANPT